MATLVDMIVHYGMHHIVYVIQCYNGEDDRPLSHIKLDSLHVWLTWYGKLATHTSKNERFIYNMSLKWIYQVRLL